MQSLARRKNEKYTTFSCLFRKLCLTLPRLLTKTVFIRKYDNDKQHFSLIEKDSMNIRRNTTFSASFNALCLAISNILPTHTDATGVTATPHYYYNWYARVKIHVFPIGKESRNIPLSADPRLLACTRMDI